MVRAPINSRYFINSAIRKIPQAGKIPFLRT